MEKKKIVTYKITAAALKYGFINILKRLQKYFPKGKETIKIKAVFDDSNEEIELSYSPKYHQLYGITRWYRAHRADIGDKIKVTVIEPQKKFRFEFQKGTKTKPLEAVKRTRKAGKGESRVGELIKFRGLVYAPINEQGVIFVFSKIIEDLNMYIEEIKTGFPDAVGRRFNGKGWIRENIEFEFKSSHFREHGHNPKECDIIVCWEHDWKECPIEVIELKSLIKKLPEQINCF